MSDSVFGFMHIRRSSSIYIFLFGSGLVSQHNARTAFKKQYKQTKWKNEQHNLNTNTNTQNKEFIC